MGLVESHACYTDCSCENKKGFGCNLVDTSRIHPVLVENGHVKQALSIIKSGQN